LDCVAFSDLLLNFVEGAKYGVSNTLAPGWSTLWSNLSMVADLVVLGALLGARKQQLTNADAAWQQGFEKPNVLVSFSFCFFTFSSFCRCQRAYFTRGRSAAFAPSSAADGLGAAHRRNGESAGIRCDERDEDEVRRCNARIHGEEPSCFAPREKDG
jgi:hypothetical protein